MTYRIDPAVHQMQPPSSNALIDCSTPNSNREQLSPRHNPMLAVGQRRDRPIRPAKSALTPYGGVNADFTSGQLLNGVPIEHAADDGRPRRVGGALNRADLQRKRGSSPPVPPLALIP
jgi:hypothetical protein